MASTLIGALRVSLGLDSAEFQRGLKNTQGQIAKFGGEMQKIGAAVSVVGAGIALAVRSQINAADDMAKMAQKIGVSVEALSQLQYAADLSGVKLEQLRTGLTILSTNLTQQAKKFDAVGIATRDAAGNMRPTIDVLADLADVLSKMPDGAEKTALAVSLLGESGAQMIPLLNGGATALRAMMGEADALGLTIDTRTAKAAERFNDALTKLQAAVTGFVRQIASALVPVMAAIAETVAGLAQQFAQLSEPMQTFLAGLAGVLTISGPLIFALGTIVKSLAAVKLAAIAAAGPWGVLAALAAAAGVAILTYGRNTNEVSGPAEEARIAIALLNEALGDNNLKTPEAAGNALRLAQDYAKQAEGALKAAEAELELLNVRVQAAQFPGVENNSNPALEALRREAAAQAGIVGSLRKDLDDARGRIKATVVQITGMDNAWKDAGQTIKSATVDLDGIEDALGRGTKAMREMAEGTKELEDPLESLSTRIGSSIEDSFMSLVDGTASVEDAFKSMASTIIAEVYRMAVVKPLVEGIMGGFGGGGGGLTGLLGGIFGGKRAEGGPISAGRTYLVGERGPELIVPQSAGTVIPNHALGGGGVTVNQVINVDGGANPATIRQEVAKLMPQIAEATKGAVIDARRRGGAMKATFG